MKNSELVELLRYSTPWSIWVVTFENKLIELKCPFMVLAIRNIGNVAKEDICEVAYIKISTNLKIVYMINKVPYFYYHFEILID